MKEGLIYVGTVPDEAYQSIADDLKNVRAVMRVALADREDLCKAYFRILTHRALCFSNGPLEPSPNKSKYLREILESTNKLLRRAHKEYGLPLWEYTVVNAWTGVGHIEVWNKPAWKKAPD